MTHAPAFTAWLEDFFAAYYRRRPVNATFIGVHTYDDRLPDYSAAGVSELLAEMVALRQRLTQLPDESLSETETLDRELAAGFLDIQDWEYRSAHFVSGNPCVYTGEAIFGVISLFLRPFAPLSQRVESAISRLHAIPTLLMQGRQNVRQAPAAWIDRAMRECEGALAFLGSGIDQLMRDASLSSDRLREAADVASTAFTGFKHYLVDTLLPTATDEVACGRSAYELLLRRGHFLDQDAATLEAYAQQQFEQAEAWLIAQAHAHGGDDWRALLAQLSTIHPTTEQYYARYGELWNACRAASDAHQLLTWPEFPIRYVPQPEWARAAAPNLYFLFYRSPAVFDHIRVHDYLVTPIEPDMPIETQEQLLHATNESVIKLNHVVHHGAIGHHVQNWHAIRATSRIGQIAAVDCASRIAMFCGGTMAEGWACYATDLMDEIGFLTPLEHTSEQHSRLRMAARALVDIRLHHGRYTLEQAAAFYHERVGMALASARNEAVKNSMFPATALMYLFGRDQIHQLRRDLADRQGSAFSLKQFHDQVLSYGSVPVSLISARMRDGTALSSSTDIAKEAMTTRL